MIRAERSHGVEDHGNNTLSVFFKLKLEQTSCSSVDPKHCVSFSARRPFESPKFTKISCKPGHGLSRKKKTRCGIACVPGDWEDATRFVLVVSFLISMVQLVQEDPTHIPYTLYTRIHIQQWKRAALLGSLLQTTRKVKGKWRKSRACCFVWENVPFWNCRLFTTSCFDFSTMFESKNCTNLLLSIHDQSARARPLAWFDLQKRHFVAIDLPVAEKTPKCMCYPILGQRKLKANNVDRQLASRKAQSSSCFDLDSDRMAVLVPRQTEVSISVWGKPSELGNSLLSTNQRPFIYTGPQALSWRPSTIRSQVGSGSRLRNLMQAINFGGTFDQLFFWIFLWSFHRRCLSTSSIPWCKKVKKWPKAQIKGVLP